MRPLLAIAAIVVVVGVSGATDHIEDQNLHVLIATLDDCHCEFFQATQDWLCFADFFSTSPPQHFSAENPAFIHAEINGQAAGQCTELQPTLPRKVRMLFWLEPGGIDFQRDIVRAQVRGYFLTGL